MTKKIRNEIIKGCKKKAISIGNRKKAINIGIKELRSNEILLIAGKGHEIYQDLGKKKIFLSDKEIVKKFKSPKKFSNIKFRIYSANFIRRLLII